MVSKPEGQPWHEGSRDTEAWRQQGETGEEVTGMGGEGDRTTVEHTRIDDWRRYLFMAANTRACMHGGAPARILGLAQVFRHDMHERTHAYILAHTLGRGGGGGGRRAAGGGGTLVLVARLAEFPRVTYGDIRSSTDQLLIHARQPDHSTARCLPTRVELSCHPRVPAVRCTVCASMQHHGSRCHSAPQW